MKIFLTWSGDRSRELAVFLRVWLRDVIHHLEPWVSDRDIPAGVMWSSEIATNLQESAAGIICVTPENQAEPWVLFEAGALASRIGTGARACTYLLAMSKADLRGPLTLYQATTADHDDTRKLLESLNQLLGSDRLPEEMLHRSFDRCWPELQRKLDLLVAAATVTRPAKRASEDILEEVLLGVRQLSRQSSDLYAALSPQAQPTLPLPVDATHAAERMSSLPTNASAARERLLDAVQRVMPELRPLIEACEFVYDHRDGWHELIANDDSTFEALRPHRRALGEITRAGNVGWTMYLRSRQPHVRV